MTGAEIGGLAMLLVAMVCFYRWIWTLKDRELQKGCDPFRSASFEVAHTGSMFAPRFSPHITNGSTLYIPTGDGCYSTRIKAKRGKKYKHDLRSWLSRGATIHLIVTQPNDDTIGVWQPLKDDFPDLLHVYLIRRERLSGPDAHEARARLQKIDTFHVVLLINPAGHKSYPGAMWVEAYHPIGSKYAYFVRYISPADVSTDEMAKYERLYKALLEETPLEELRASPREIDNPPMGEGNTCDNRVAA